MSDDEDYRKNPVWLLGQIDGKLDMLIKQGGVQDDRISAIDGRVRAVERVAAPAVEFDKRLRAVESKQHWYAGAAAAIGAVAGALGFKISFHG